MLCDVCVRFEYHLELKRALGALTAAGKKETSTKIPGSTARIVCK